MRIIKRKTKGFTLIELLVAAMISIVVVSAALHVYVVQHKQMLVQDQISDMQQNLRTSLNEICGKVTMAGYRLPPGLSPIVARNTNPDTIQLTYNIDLVDDVVIEHDMPQPSAELRCDGHDLSGIADGDWLYIYDPVSKTGEFFQTTHVQYSSGHIQHNTMPLSKSYKKGSLVLKITSVKFYIDRSTDTSHPRLMVQYLGMPAQIYAPDIVDLQCRYILSSGALVDVPPLATMVREVLITLTARTERADREFATAYRTRTLQTRVKVRNLGIG